MATLLLGEALAQRLHQLVEAELLDLGALLGREIFLDHLAQPFLGNLRGRDGLAERKDALEHIREGDVESVEMALVLDQHRARKPVEILDRGVGHFAIERADQVEKLARRDRDVRLAQFCEEIEKHALC